MSDEFLGVSAVALLAILIFLSWLTGSKNLKIFTALFMLGYPLLIGEVQFPQPSVEGVVGYVGDVIKYWFLQVWEQVWNYIKDQVINQVQQNMNPFNWFGG